MAPLGQGRTLQVLIPAFDELANLRVLLPQFEGFNDSSPGITIEPTVIVPTHASDNEIREIERLNAKVVVREPSDTFGDAIRTGIRSIAPSADYVVFMDADGSHIPGRILDMLPHAATADVVVASRYTKGGSSDNTLMLKTMSLLLNRAYSMVLGINCKDVSTNFKLYHAKDLRGISLACNNFDVVEEILFRLQEQKRPQRLVIVEIPDHFAQRNLGDSKRRLGPYIASYLWTLGRLRINKARASHGKKSVRGSGDYERAP